MTIKVQDERKGSDNYVNSNILECVKFWNREGISIYSKNISGALGSKETNELARSTTYADFVLEMLMIDCRTFCKSNFATKSDIKFESGRVRSHVWFHEDDDRKLMIYAE
jgi:hypothetical protein